MARNQYRVGVISPLKLTKVPAKSNSHTLETLTNRLAVAEMDTMGLVEQLNKIGNKPNTSAKHAVSSTTLTTNLALEKDFSSYEQLVSRLCKSESTLQTLKETVSELETGNEAKSKAEQKINAIKTACDTELKKLEKELLQMKVNLKEALEMKNHAVAERDHLQKVIQEILQTKQNISCELEGLVLFRQKLDKKLTDGKEQIAREIQLRQSLEEGQKVLMDRLQEVEAILKQERLQAHHLSADYADTQRKLLLVTDELEKERNQRHHLQTFIDQVMPDGVSPLKTFEDTKAKLLQEVQDMRDKYNTIHKELDDMTKHMAEKQKYQATLEKGKQKLESAFEEHSKKQADLIADYESQIETLKMNLHFGQQNKELKDTMKSKLMEEAKLKVQAEEKCKQLQQQLLDVQSQLSTKERQLGAVKQTMKQECEQLQQLLVKEQRNKEERQTEKEKEASDLITKLTNEKQQLEVDLEENNLQLQRLENAKGHLQYENRQLMDRVNLLEQAKENYKGLENTLKEMFEEKKQLAYDKGKLQNRIDQLQQEIATLTPFQTEATHLKRLQQNLEAKIAKVELELLESQGQTQHIESQLEQARVTIQRKEVDLRECREAQLQSQKECERLTQQLERFDQRESQRALELKKQLQEAQGEKKQSSEKLESMVAAQRQLQVSYTQMQSEMGAKDEIIQQLRSERQQLQRDTIRLEKELKTSRDQLDMLREFEKTDVEPLKSAIEKYKAENAKLLSISENAVIAREQLKSAVENLEFEVQKKVELINRHQAAREHDQKQHETELIQLEKRMENLKEHLAKDRESSTKKTYKDVIDLRKKIEELLGRNGELSRGNAELRRKLTEVEFENKDFQEKIIRLKQSNEHLTKVKAKQEEAIKSLECSVEQLRELEKSKNFYIKKNKEQAQMLQQFMNQIASLQEEVQSLAQSQMDTTVLLQEQEVTLNKQQSTVEEWERKYQEVKSREEELELLNRQAEEKIKEATDESMMMSSSLQDAHQWFTGKFQHLHQKLIKSKKSKAQYDKDSKEVKAMLEEERLRSTEAATRADTVIKASQLAVSKVADEAENIRHKYKNQIKELKRMLDTEREHSRQAEKRLLEFQDSSFRYTEKLAKELEEFKSHSGYTHEWGDY